MPSAPRQWLRTRRRRRQEMDRRGRGLLGLHAAWRICWALALAIWTQVATADNAPISMDLYGITSGTTYTVYVDVGTAASSSANSTFRIITDTGSSTDAVLGAGCCGGDEAVTFQCSASSSCVASDGSVTLDFAGATITGQFVNDKWTNNATGAIAKDFLVIEQQTSFYRSDYDGITGLAYSSLKRPQSSPRASYYENLVAAKQTKDTFGLQLCGVMQPMLQASSFPLHAGQWVIGGTNGPNGEMYHTEPILYAPIVQESWYMVTITDIGFDNESLGMSCSKYNEPQAIIDSGTSNMAFPSDIYNALISKIGAATKKAVPEFDTDYLNYQQSCCGVSYCDPTNASLALLTLPSIYITLAMEDPSGSSTTQHFTVEIPPQYYYRPEMNGVNANKPCRVMGIAESSSIVLGDVFMDGLFTYHDRAGGRIGLAIADNCANGAKSTKKVYKTEKSLDWCDCFSSTQKSRSRLASYLPWGKSCFFMLWWMYIVLISAVVILICIGIVTYWWWTGRRTKNKFAAAHVAVPRGSCRSHSHASPRATSADSSWQTHPSLQRTRARSRSGNGTGQGSSHGDTFVPIEQVDDAQPYAMLLSPRDTALSRGSSVVMLGASAENPFRVSVDSIQHESDAPPRQDSSHDEPGQSSTLVANSEQQQQQGWYI